MYLNVPNEKQKKMLAVVFKVGLRSVIWNWNFGLHDNSLL